MGAGDYNAKGIFYLERGQYRKGINNLNKAIMMNPDDIPSRIQRGKFYFYLLKYEKGIEDLSEVIRLKPDDAEIYNYRGSEHFILGNNNLGCRDAQKACALGNCTLLQKSKDEGLCY
jgi:superkiller protein 3